MPYPKPLIALSLLLSSLSLAGCVTVPTPPMKTNYPDELFRCLDAPNAENIDTDNALAVFIAEMAAAHLDCKTRLANLQETVNGEDE
jgi:hypothetical protein